MIITRIDSLEHVLPAHPELAPAVLWLKEFDGSGFDPAVTVPGVNPDFQYFSTKALGPDDRLEAHRVNIDVHYIYGGAEVVCVADLDGLTQTSEYDEKDDMVFYEIPEGAHEVTLNEHWVAVLFPADAHKARIAVTEPEDVKKIVIKVRI